MSSPPKPNPRGRTIRWVACLVLASAAAVVLGLGASRSAADGDEQAGRADRLEIWTWRARLHQTLLDEVNALMLGLNGAGDAVDLAAVRAARIETHAAASDALASIAESDSIAADEAMALCDLLTKDGLDGVEQADAVRLVQAAWAALDVGAPGPHQLSETDRQLYDLLPLGTAGGVVLNDALDAAFAQNKPKATPLLREYVRQSERSIHENAGYYGPDPDHPLANSPLYRPSADEQVALVDDVDTMIAATTLWAYDAWNRSWRGRPTPIDAPPVGLALLADTARITDAAIRSDVEAALITARDTAASTADERHLRALVETAAAAVLAALVIGAVALITVRTARRIRATAALVGTDRLTGVGNRHALHEQTAAMLADPAHSSHLVAMIDLDRFKIVNDSWGHAVGDEVLRQIATALTDVVADHTASGSGTGTVIRLGGDEFLLTLHGRRPIDRTDLTRRLEAIRARSIEPRPGERLALAFSLGVVAIDGPCDVDDVLRTADLAAYEDKARRAPVLVDRRVPFAPPTSPPSTAPIRPTTDAPTPADDPLTGLKS